MTDFLHNDEVYAIVGAAMDVYTPTGMKVGLLINFGHDPSLEWKRLVFTKAISSHSTARMLRDDSTDYQTSISDD